MHRLYAFLCAISLILSIASCSKKSHNPEMPEPPESPEWTDPPAESCDTSIAYFKNDVEKLIVRKCTPRGYEFGCHGEKPYPNDVNLTTYNEIIKLVDLNQFDPDKSALYLQLDDDSLPMPYKDLGGKFNSQEKSLIRKWIEQGARNNACDPCTAYESFSASVAPLLFENCSGCHNTRSARGGLVMLPYLGKVEDIKFEEVRSKAISIANSISRNQNHMPKNRDKLYECEYNLIVNWINNGYPDD